MTRQLIIGSALIAAVSAPALAGTATNVVGGSTRATNPAAMAAPSTNLARLHTASNLAESVRVHLPVDFIVRNNNAAEEFKAPDVLINRSNDAGLFRVSNPAILFRKATPIVHFAEPLSLDDRRLRRGCLTLACVPFVLRDPSLVSHHVSAQDRLDLRGGAMILRRPAPGHTIGIELHIGDTTSVNGKIDNQ